MMHIAVLGDLHLGRSLYGFDLSPHIQRVMWDFFEFCKQGPPCIAVQLGDVFDRPTPTERQRKVVAQWCNEFTRAGIPLFILVGNHDAMAKHSSASALQYLKASTGEHIWIIDRPTLIRPTDDERACANLLMLPFPSPGIYDGSEEFFEDAEQALQSRDEDYQTIAFAHLNIEGAKLGNQEFVYRGADFSLPERDEVDQYICGHIHKPQRIRNKVEVVGAAERLRFDETGQQRFFGLVKITTKEEYASFSISRVLRHNALNLVELEVDASGMSKPDEAPSTDEVISDIAKADINRAIVKLTPFVDKHTMVDWSAVQNWLYADGALHVHVAAPVQVTEERAKGKSRVTVKDPEKAAKGFIKERVRSKKERMALFSMFVQALREVEDAD